MGAYLSQPKTEKFSKDEASDYVNVGSSSMQGWRNTQEDAHNAILDFDVNTSFFAVYDGHGGAEVATYCADKLPAFLKSLETYKGGDYVKALKEAFLQFDKTLLEENVIELLKELAGDNEEGEMEEDLEELVDLHEEGSLSLKNVLKRYGADGIKLIEEHQQQQGNIADENEDAMDDDDDDDDSMCTRPFLHGVMRITEGGPKPQSPYLRGRRAAAVRANAVNKAELNKEAQATGASTSAAAAILNDAGPSTSSAKKVYTEDDSTVSSTNTMANNVSNKLNAHNHVSTEAEAVPVTKKAEEKLKPTINGPIATPDSSHIVKENEQNGSVTSTEKTTPNKNEQVSTSSSLEKAASVVADTNNIDDGVSASSDAKTLQQNGKASSSASTSIVDEAGAKKVKRGMFYEDDSTDDETDGDYNANENSADGDDEEDDDDEEMDHHGNSSDEEEYGEEEEDIDDEEEEDDDGDDEERFRDTTEDDKANEKFYANMAEEPGKDSGCTAVVALLNGRDLYVANAGDSRCIVSRQGKPIEMSLDHKPEDEEETTRILKAGGRVTVDGRVNGGLNLSRAIGDHAYKMNEELSAEEQMISALPDIKKLIITPEDEFMVLACDGIWNFLTNEEVVDFVRTRLIEDESQPLSKICEELFDKCLAPNTTGDGTGCDNMTAVIVRFKSNLQKLDTKLQPDEVEQIKPTRIVEPATAASAGEEAEEATLKRSASSSLDDEPPTQNKRLKTDSEEDNNLDTASSTITSSTTSKGSSSSSRSGSTGNAEAVAEAATTNVIAESGLSSSAQISTSEASTSTKSNSQVAEANECDSLIPDSSEASPAVA